MATGQQESKEIKDANTHLIWIISVNRFVHHFPVIAGLCTWKLLAFPTCWFTSSIFTRNRCSARLGLSTTQINKSTCEIGFRSVMISIVLSLNFGSFVGDDATVESV